MGSVELSGNDRAGAQSGERHKGWYLSGEF